MDQEKVPWLILRLGLAFAFAYAAISGFSQPENWIGYFPFFVQNFAPPETLLQIWGSIQIAIAIWLLFGRQIRIAGAVSALALLGLILANLGAMEIIFRDVAILAIALALTTKRE